MAEQSVPPQATPRCYDRRKIKNITEQLAADLCRAAGVLYSGIQRGFGVTEDMLLFADRHGSTLAVPIPGASAEAIQAKIIESDERWNNQGGH